MAFTVAECEESLKIWLDAEKKIAVNQKYTIKNIQYDRANLAQVREQIKFWDRELTKAKNREYGRSKRRVMRIVPRDL